MAKQDFHTRFRLAGRSARLLLNIPDDADQLTEVEGDRQIGGAHKDYDWIAALAPDLQTFKNLILEIWSKKALRPDAMLFVIYPKLGNKVYPEGIHRDDIFPYLNVDDAGYCLDTTYKFNAMFSLNATYTVVGIKNAPNRQTKAATGPSQLARDYEHRLDELRELLAVAPDALAFFDSLTPGYKRGWARYVFGVRQEKTRNKRLEEAVRLLTAGVKAYELR